MLQYITITLQLLSDRTLVATNDSGWFANEGLNCQDVADGGLAAKYPVFVIYNASCVLQFPM